MADWIIEDWQSSVSAGEFVARFAAFPDAVRQEPYRVGLLAPQHLKGMLELPWPKARNFFMATIGERVVATIGASLSARDPALGMIGFYECDLAQPEAATASQALIAAAENFLRDNGARKLLAPVNYSTWFQYRFLKPGTEPPFYGWEPVQPPAFHDHFLQAGYAPGEEYVSVGHADATPFIQLYLPALEKALANGYTLRPFDSQAFLDRDVPSLYRITMAAFADSYLFEPIPFEAFRNLYVPIGNKVDLSHSAILVNASGVEVGFVFAFFDPQFRDHFVVKTLTVIPDERGKGLSNALVCYAFKRGHDHGSRRTVHAMMRSEGQSRSYGKYVTIDWEHQYQLMEKSI